MWLALIALAFYRSISFPGPWCLLSFSAVAGWELGELAGALHPLWKGLGVLGLALLGLTVTGGGQLGAGAFSVESGFRAVTGDWHPTFLAGLIVLKNLAALGAPILPWLAAEPALPVLGAFPLLGALSAGNMTSLWQLRFAVGTGISNRLLDDGSFLRAAWAAVIAWVLLGMWVVTHLDLVPHPVRVRVRKAAGKPGRRR
jgi:hypothetical protein